MDLMKEVFGQAEPKPEPKSEPKHVPKVEPKSVTTVEPKHVSMIEPNHVRKPEPEPKVETPKPVATVEPKVELKAVAKVQPVDNEKLQRLERELDQAERDYKDSVWVLTRAKQQYFLLRNGYDRDPENSSKEVVYKASSNVADCQARQDAIDRKRNSLKKQIAELKGGANGQ